MKPMIDKNYLDDLHEEVKKIFENLEPKIQEYSEPKLLKFLKDIPWFKDTREEMLVEFSTVCSRVASRLAKKYPKYPEQIIARDLGFVFIGYYMRYLDEHEQRYKLQKDSSK